MLLHQLLILALNLNKLIKYHMYFFSMTNINFYAFHSKLKIIIMAIYNIFLSTYQYRYLDDKVF